MAKQLKVKEQYNHHFEYTNDIDRIVKIFADRGYEISATDAVHAWEMVSNNWAAGWLTLHEDEEEVFQDCFRHMKENK